MTTEYDAFIIEVHGLVQRYNDSHDRASIRRLTKLYCDAKNAESTDIFETRAYTSYEQQALRARRAFRESTCEADLRKIFPISTFQQLQD